TKMSLKSPTTIGQLSSQYENASTNFPQQRNEESLNKENEEGMEDNAEKEVEFSEMDIQSVNSKHLMQVPPTRSLNRDASISSSKFKSFSDANSNFVDNGNATY